MRAEFKMYVHFVIFLSTGIFKLEIFKILKVLNYPFFSRNSKKLSRKHNRKLLRKTKLLSDAMETDLRGFDLKGNFDLMRVA